MRRLIELLLLTDKIVMKSSKSLPFLLAFFLCLFFSKESLEAASSEDCSKMNHPAYQDEYRACLRLQIADSAQEAGVDCIDCIYDKGKKESNDFVEALEAVAQPLAYLAATYTISKYENATQEKWANAYASGFAECTNRFNSFLNYNTAIGANPLTTSEAQSFANSCNGNGYGGYAGYGGLAANTYGGYGNPFLANGFSSGFMSGYGGGYWGQSQWGVGSINNTGMLSGSIGISGTLTTGSSSTGVVPAFTF